jgi:DNA-binding HxlR family transcriptional regulator
MKLPLCNRTGDPMRRTSFSDMSCSIARTLEFIGDWWTLLIVREAFFGSRKFGEFEKSLGIAPNVLTQRLGKLVEAEILSVVSVSQNGRALAYRLTPKGRDLFPVLMAMMQWGDKHAAGPEGAPVRVLVRSTGQEIAPMRLQSPDGAPLDVAEVMVVAGPGASEAVTRRMAAIAAQRQPIKSAEPGPST